MKRILLMSALAALILTLVTPLVNAPISNDSPRAGATPGGSVVLADGSPIPPCAPCGCSCRQNPPDVQAVRPATQPRLG